MKNIQKFSLTLLACATLVACGSSGGGNNGSSGNSGNSGASNHNSNPLTPENPTVLSPSNPSNPSNDAKLPTGKVIIMEGEDNNQKVTEKVLFDSNLQELIVDGQSFKLAYDGIYSGGWTRIKSVITSGSSYKSTQFGMIADKKGYVFYKGIPTTEMPTSGVANYAGTAVIAGETEHFTGENGKSLQLYGETALTADFGNKTLTGQIITKELQPIHIDAKINNNSFAGTASSATFAESSNTEGQFFGKNAEELSGLIYKTDANGNFTGGFGGAFGGKKQ